MIDEFEGVYERQGNGNQGEGERAVGVVQDLPLSSNGMHFQVRRIDGVEGGGSELPNGKRAWWVSFDHSHVMKDKCTPALAQARDGKVINAGDRVQMIGPRGPVEGTALRLTLDSDHLLIEVDPPRRSGSGPVMPNGSRSFRLARKSYVSEQVTRLDD